MGKTGKSLCLLPMGLLCAAVVYPALHELGHGLAAFLLGAKGEELRWFPLPSILCGMDGLGPAEYAAAGMGWIVLPAALCLMIRSCRRFWIWYAVFVVKLICIWSLLLAAGSMVLYRFGILLPNDDMGQILQRYPQVWQGCGILTAALCLTLCVSVVRSRPIQRIAEEL